MKTQGMLVVVAMLVGCGGGGVPWTGDLPEEVGPATASAGTVWSSTAGEPSAFGGTNAGGYAVGGNGSDSAGGYETGGYGTAGTAVGGYEMGGTGVGYAGTPGGGYEMGGTGAGGYEVGGASSAGAPSGGAGSYDQCGLNVARCFEAASNCYEFSPWSDCDQIVDVCAALQLQCAE